MAFYIVVGKRPEGLSPLLTRIFGVLASRITLPIGRLLAGVGISPNQVTVVGFLIIIWGSVLVASGSFFLGGWLLVVGAIFDLLDGAVAKGAGKKTAAGAFLDSTLDRLSDGCIFIAIAFPYMSITWPSYSPDFAGQFLAQPIDPWIPILSLACMLLGFLTSYIRARAEGLGFECRVGIAERPERMIIAAAGLIFQVLLLPALVLLTILSLITVVQRFVHVWKQARSAAPL